MYITKSPVSVIFAMVGLSLLSVGVEASGGWRRSKSGVALDKDEGIVKAQFSCAVREHRAFCQRSLRTKALVDSRCIT
jgi:hypothetical protein